jgi:hypothetical protein
LEFYFIPYFLIANINLLAFYSCKNRNLSFIFIGHIILYYFFIILLSFIRIPPRWIEIATGNFIFWISYFISFYFLFSFYAYTNGLLFYSHFVDLLWLVIDFVVYFL